METFAHLRTPVLMSTVRAFDGLIVGIVFGVLAVVACRLPSISTYLLEGEPQGMVRLPFQVIMVSNAGDRRCWRR